MSSSRDIILESYEHIVRAWRSLDIEDGKSLGEALGDFPLRFSYNSGRIENPQITYHDTRSVFEDGRAAGFTGDVRTLFEIQNLKSSHEQLLDAFDLRLAIDEELTLAFQKTLTQGTYDQRRWDRGERPGKYKVHDYVVGVHDAGAPASQVAKEMTALFEELEAATEQNILTAASYFHLAFEGIHPFADGNGRCGRALTNYLLVLHNHPPHIVFDEDKMSYYGAIQAWEAGEGLGPMCEFMCAQTVKTWARMLG